MTKKIRIDEIELEGCQSRAGTCEATVEEYAELWTAGAEFPPVVLFSDGAKYYCGDGHHRIMGADKALIETIEAHVSKGGKSDALWYSTSANAIHGKRRTNADKRNAVKIALKLKPEMSDRAVADHCGVGPDLVSSVRGQVSENDTSKSPAKRVGKDGKSYPAKPSSSGKPSGGGSFNPKEWEGAADPQPPKASKNGRPTVDTKLWNKSHELAKELIKSLEPLGIAERCSAAVSVVFDELNALKGL